MANDTFKFMHCFAFTSRTRAFIPGCNISHSIDILNMVHFL